MLARVNLFAGAVALAGIVAAFGFGSMAGCSSDEAAPADAGPETAPGPEGDLCNGFTSVGQPCAPVSNKACFPECEKGGCFCRAGQDGKGVWSCVTDLSCYPVAGPLEDTGVLPSFDAGFDDAPKDAPSDVLDASDSG
jgi:hypothetical protein